MVSKKAFTLIETLVSIAIISLLLLIIVEILLVVSKYNKKVGYVQEADIKTKEIAIKIERILYNQDKLNIKTYNNNVLVIYTTKGNYSPLVEFYYSKAPIGRKYYRKIVVHYPNSKATNFTYVPDNVFWQISDKFVLKNSIVNTNLYYQIDYLYNFSDNTDLIYEKTIPSIVNKDIKNLIFQHLAIKFYVYHADPYGREFSQYISQYIKDKKPIPKPLLVYLINILIVPSE